MMIKQYILTNRNPLSNFRFASILFFFICCYSQTFAFSGSTAGLAHTAKKLNVQQKAIKGKVISTDDNLGIPGVNVVVKGTAVSTTTDLDGNYTIEADAASVLVFTGIGFKTQEITVGTQSTIDVSMVTESKNLEEVVIVGYGTQKKVTVTGAIETVSARNFQDRAVTNPALALQGASPGLVVTRSTTRPGREGINLQIRGATSINGGDPLLIIDGVPAINTSAFYNMNADDIQSVTVLKDGSAAIYGSRAANGVILVTTKKGALGKMKVEFSSNLRVNTIGITPPVSNMQKYAKVWQEATDQDGANANYWLWYTRDNIDLLAQGYEGIYTLNPANGQIYLGQASRFDEMFGTSYSTLHNASISGATDKTSYRLSYGYAEDIGALKTAYDGKVQHNIRFNYDYNVYDWLKIESNVSYLQFNVSSPSTGLDAASVVSDPPFFPARNPYGQWYANFNAGNRNAVAATVDGGREKSVVDQVKVYLAATIKFTKDLSFKTTASYNKDFNQFQSYLVNVPQYTWFGVLANESVNTTPSITERNINASYQNYGGYLDYVKSFGNHNITAMVGINAEKFMSKTLQGSRRGFTDLGVYDLNLGSREILIDNNGGASNSGFYSYLGRITYDFKNKYLFEVNGRNDGTSKFAVGYKFSSYGSAQAGWVVTNENFMKAIKPLSLFKLRVSHSIMGGQQGIGNHDYVSTIGNGTALFGTTATLQNSSWVNSITTNERWWEKISLTNYGVDFGLFDGKLSGYFEYFTKKNDDMFVRVTYPEVLGGAAPPTNDGTLKAKGWEAQLGYRDHIGKFNYNVSVNMSNSTNKIVSMPNAFNIVAGKNATVEGYPINSYFMYETAGLFQTQEQVDRYYATYAAPGAPAGDLGNLTTVAALRPGDMIRVDRDGNGVISPTVTATSQGDLKYMGDAAPHYVYGINLSAQYGGFDITTFFNGVLEQNVQRTGYLAYPFATLYTNQPSSYIGKTWTAENTGAEYPRMTNNVNRARWNWANNDFALQNNRYIRLKTLVVGYTLSDLQIADFKLDKFRVFFSGNDLWEATSIKDGYDPEFGESSQTIYPFSRTWSLGLNVSF